MWDVLGFPWVARILVEFCPTDKRLARGSFPQIKVAPVYFDREDVKRAIHAPVNSTWAECGVKDVFPDEDSSMPPAFSVLPSVIERSERSVLMHGLLDFVLIAEG